MSSNTTEEENKINRKLWTQNLIETINALMNFSMLVDKMFHSRKTYSIPLSFEENKRKKIKKLGSE